MSDDEQLPLWWIQHPFRGILHGSAAIISVFGAVVLWRVAEGDPQRQLMVLVFGASLVSLYTVSSLYHSVPWQVHWKTRMQRLDHAMIYVLIAGTYTPIAAVALQGWERRAALGMVWGIAIAGVLQKTFWPEIGAWLSMTLQMVQGWTGGLFLASLGQTLPPPAVAMIVAGGILYTIGLVGFVTQRPRLWPHVFSYHEVFHLLVVAGSALHYTSIVRYIAPFGG